MPCWRALYALTCWLWRHSGPFVWPGRLHLFLARFRGYAFAWAEEDYW